MNRIDVMVDLETLGTESNSTVLQISAVAFDIRTGELGASFNKLADISKNESYDMQVSGGTLKWWLTDKSDVLTDILLRGEGTSSELIESFGNWLRALGFSGDVYLWGNGILFDNRILREQMGVNYPINMRRDRDVRTIVDLYCTKHNVTEKALRDKFYDYNTVAHDAFNDVRNQVRMVSGCYRDLIGDKENEPT